MTIIVQGDDHILEQVEKQLQQVQAAANMLADKTFQVRSEHAAFQEFLAANPSIRLQWQAFVGQSPLGLPAFCDPLGVDWPLPNKLRN
jgi:hypothetical protein